MATHDYVIDNSTGANVRADINLVLQAILTNNSSSSAPSTTAAYMWWADTSNGILKIRNSSDNAWVELLQLDGTLTLEDGSASTPGLAFRDDLNTGIFSSAADTFNIATGGSERTRIDSSGRLLLGTDTSRAAGGSTHKLFQIEATDATSGISLTRNSNGATSSIISFAKSRGTSNGSNTIIQDGDELGRIKFSGADGNDLLSEAARISSFVDGTPGSNDMPGCLVFSTTADSAASSTERMRIDSSGRLLLGTTTSRSTYGSNPNLQVAGTGFDSSSILLRRDSNDGNPSAVVFGKSRGSAGGNTVVQDDDQLGSLVFAAADGTDLTSVAAEIRAQIDGTPGGNDVPGRIVFRTTADGASSPSDKIVIDKDGFMTSRLYIGNSNGGDYWQFTQSAGGTSTQATANFYASSTATRFHIAFLCQDAVKGSISASSSGTTYATTSDYRLKENVVTLSDAITRLKTLKPYRFNFKDDTDTTVDGFFAHEVTAVPEAITGTKDEVDSDNKPVYQGIDQSKLVPLLVAAVQELITKVEALEAA